jgi:hypothetical protein
MHQKFSAKSDENHDRWGDQKKDSSLLQIVFLFPRNLVVNALQSLVPEKRRLALLQQEGIDVRTVFAKNSPKLRPSSSRASNTSRYSSGSSPSANFTPVHEGQSR